MHGADQSYQYGGGFAVRDHQNCLEACCWLYISERMIFNRQLPILKVCLIRRTTTGVTDLYCTLSSVLHILNVTDGVPPPYLWCDISEVAYFMNPMSQ